MAGLVSGEGYTVTGNNIRTALWIHEPQKGKLMGRILLLRCCRFREEVGHGRRKLSFPILQGGIQGGDYVAKLRSFHRY